MTQLAMVGRGGEVARRNEPAAAIRTAEPVSWQHEQSGRVSFAVRGVCDGYMRGERVRREGVGEADLEVCLSSD